MNVSFGSINLRIDPKINQLAKESPYQAFFLVGARQAKKYLSHDKLNKNLLLKPIETSTTTDSFGQKSFKVLLIDEDINTQIMEPLDDGIFNSANKFKDFIIKSIENFYNR